jgi:hypothetical protein
MRWSVADDGEQPRALAELIDRFLSPTAPP